MSQCVHLGEPDGNLASCGSCRKHGVQLKVFACEVHGQCTPAREARGLRCCAGNRGPGGTVVPCPDRSDLPQTPPPFSPQALASRTPSPPLPSPEEGLTVPTTRPTTATTVPATPHSKVRWAVGVTTVHSRLADPLPQTLASLRKAGFDRPRLFADGVGHREAARLEEDHHLQVTARSGGAVRTAGNWVLALLELLVRFPAVDRYALFQDDLLAVRNLRPYLERACTGERRYWNLLRHMDNEAHLEARPPGFHDASEWCPGEQSGRGAVALVFSREGVLALLRDRDFSARPTTAEGHKKVDGGIVVAMNRAGYREQVHTPSLVQHVGHQSSMDNRPLPQALSFLGEGWDALSLLVPKS